MEEFETKYEATAERLNEALDKIATVTLEKAVLQKRLDDIKAQPSENLKDQVTSMKERVAEAERVKEQKMTENFNLKEVIERSRNEQEKQKKRLGQYEDRLDQKEMTVQQQKADLEQLQRKLRLNQDSAKDAQLVQALR